MEGRTSIYAVNLSHLADTSPLPLQCGKTGNKYRCINSVIVENMNFSIGKIMLRMSQISLSWGYAYLNWDFLYIYYGKYIFHTSGFLPDKLGGAQEKAKSMNTLKKLQNL